MENVLNHDKMAATPALGGPPGVQLQGPGGGTSGAELSKLYKEMDDKVGDGTAKIYPENPVTGPVSGALSTQRTL